MLNGTQVPQSQANEELWLKKKLKSPKQKIRLNDLFLIF